MGGSHIRISPRHPGVGTRKWRLSSKSGWHGRATHLSDDRQYGQGTSFRLPETCRQIYSESATLGYATNRFILPPRLFCNEYPAFSLWHKRRSTAQLSAITSIQADTSDLREYFVGDEIHSFRSRFPSLEELFIPSWQVESVKIPHTAHGHENVEEYIQAKVKKLDGENLRVVFSQSD